MRSLFSALAAPLCSTLALASAAVADPRPSSSPTQISANTLSLNTCITDHALNALQPLLADRGIQDDRDARRHAEMFLRDEKLSYAALADCLKQLPGIDPADVPDLPQGEILYSDEKTMAVIMRLTALADAYTDKAQTSVVEAIQTRLLKRAGIERLEPIPLEQRRRNSVSYAQCAAAHYVEHYVKQLRAMNLPKTHLEAAYADLKRSPSTNYSKPLVDADMARCLLPMESLSVEERMALPETVADSFAIERLFQRHTEDAAMMDTFVSIPLDHLVLTKSADPVYEP